MRRLRGVVLDAKGTLAANVPVKVASIEETLAEESQTLSSEDGSFEFPLLYDGEWRVSAELPSSSAKVAAFALAQIAGRDLDRMELQLTAPMTLHGSVSLGAESIPDSQKRRVQIFLKPYVRQFDRIPHGTAERDGNFKLENVYPGRYKIIAVSPDSPYFPASATIGDQETLGQFVEIASDTLPIKITLDSKGGVVRGQVEDCGNATVVLAPQNTGLQEVQFVRSARCDETGRFNIANIMPGDYYAFAFDQWEGAFELLSNFDQSIANRAVSVSVPRGGVTAVDLKLTTRNP